MRVRYLGEAPRAAVPLRPAHPTADRRDIYERITATIIAQIEAGAGQFKMPWHRRGNGISLPRNLISDKSYRGLNVLLLWSAANDAGYPTGTWATYDQWQSIGAQVRKGERSTAILFWKSLSRQQSDESPSDETEGRPKLVARMYSVFNAAQVDGYQPEIDHPFPSHQRIERAEQFCQALNLDVRHGGDRAFYVPSQDFITMPEFEQFHSPEAFYGVLLHEAGHASGAKHRLDRDLSGRFGTEAYAFEEIIVELASAMVCAELGLAVEARQENAAYISHWLSVLRADKRAIFTAASKAQQISDWMHAQQPTGPSGPD